MTKRANEIIKPPANAVQVYPDSTRYKCGYAVRSESSGQLYKISFDAADGAGYWTCSCRGNISHGSCKHLEAAGLRGRKFGKDVATLKALGLR